MDLWHTWKDAPSFWQTYRGIQRKYFYTSENRGRFVVRSTTFSRKFTTEGSEVALECQTRRGFIVEFLGFEQSAPLRLALYREYSSKRCHSGTLREKFT